MKTEHTCNTPRTCTCYMLALEPNENCPVHGFGPPPPLRCEMCGKFIRRIMGSMAKLEYALA